MENNGFASFALYNALKLHFSSDSYDFFKYNGKTNISKDKFATRKDKYTFCKLSRNYSLDDLTDFYVSNFISRDINWVGELTNEEGQSTYMKWKKTSQSLSYVFTDDLECLFTDKNPDEVLKVPHNDFPKLLKMCMSSDITIETLCILNDILNFIPIWDKKIQDDIIWPNWKKKIIKYTPFISYDKKKLTNILKEAIK